MIYLNFFKLCFVLELCVAFCDTVFIINKEWMLQNKLNCCRWFCFSVVSLDQQRNWTSFSCLLLWIFSLKSKTSKIIIIIKIIIINYSEYANMLHLLAFFSRNAWLHDVSDHNFLQLYELTGVPSGSLCYNNWLKSEFEIISQMWNQIKQNQDVYMMLKNEYSQSEQFSPSLFWLSVTNLFSLHTQFPLHNRQF